MSNLDSSLATLVDKLNSTMTELATPAKEALIGQAVGDGIQGFVGTALALVGLVACGAWLYYMIKRGRETEWYSDRFMFGTGIAGFVTAMMTLATGAALSNASWFYLAITHPTWYIAHQLLSH